MAKKSTGAGAATNAGIEYQQRISALFLTAMLLEHKVEDYLDLDTDAKIIEVCFETSDHIDDLKMTLEDTRTLYLQIKRSIDLSVDNASDFAKTIQQFASQYAQHQEGNEQYLLVTSSDASRKIIKELQKILESLRLHDNAFTQNPLSQSERDTLTKFRQVANNSFKQATGQIMTDDMFSRFASKIVVAVLDLKANKEMEKALTLALSQVTIINPNLLWAMMIKDALYYASNRLSVSKVALQKKLDRFLTHTPAKIVTAEDISNELPALHLELIGDIPSGKEVLLIESFINPNDSFYFELFRFEDDGSKRFDFYEDNKCQVVGSDMTWTVIHRSATHEGMLRFIDDHVQLLKRGKLAYSNAHDIEGVECLPHVQAQRALCQTLYSQNKTPLRCLHCTKAISENGASLVEIDRREAAPTVGYVHQDCLRPIDRVLGVMKTELFSDYGYLQNFDYEAWVKGIRGGQAVFNGISNMRNTGVTTIYWNSEYEYDADYSYCLKFHFADGSEMYVEARGRVQRFRENEAREHAQQFNAQFETQRGLGNPWCYTTKRYVFGVYNLLVESKMPDEDCIECLYTEEVRYSDVIAKSYNSSRNFYAPLCLLVYSEVEEPLVVGVYAVMVSDPFNLKSFLDNWKRAGFDCSQFETKVIGSDREFDELMRGLRRKSLKAIVDPILNNETNFVQGVIIDEFQQHLK